MTRQDLTSSFRGQGSGQFVGAVVLGVVLALSTPTVFTAGAARAVDDRTIAHVLNRMAFGPAPGDVERVRQMGLERYIDQQLHPERLPDGAMAERLARLETLKLSARDIAERYFLPLQEMQRELQRERGKEAGDNAMPGQGSGTGTEMKGKTGGAATPTPGAPPEGSAGASAGDMDAREMGAPGMQDEAMRRRPNRPDGPPNDRDALLAKLSPEERRKAIELRQQNQRILGELGEQKLLRAVYSDRQLEEVLVDFWFNHFNVFAGKGPVRLYVTEYERDTIRPHVLGKFRDLLGATAHSPAMLFYLDNWQSVDPNAQLGPMRRGLGDDGKPRRANSRGGQQRPNAGRGRFANLSEEERRARLQQIQQRMPKGLNENYARELMELHTLGVNGGYTQADIVEVAKCFTGWTIQEPRRGGTYRFDPRRHTPGAKTVLGTQIDKGGEGDGDAVLDLLAKHPSTATFIATKLARRFVADDPPKALVEHAAAKFRATDGDLREVVRTILTSPEFVSAEAMRAKVKTPFEFVASALRATAGRVDDGTVLVRNLQGMGMPLYMAQPPTGYADRADVWVNTGALLNRMNFAVALVNNRLRGVTVDLAPLAPNGSGDLTAARDTLLATLLANDVSEATRATIAKGDQVTQVAALTLGSPEFQRR